MFRPWTRLTTLFLLLLWSAPLSAQVDGDAEQQPAKASPRELALALMKNAETGTFLGVGECAAHHAVTYKPKLRLVMLTDQRAIAPNQSFQLALMFNLDPAWHLYYGPNPGGIGLPTSVKLRLPEGFTHSPFLWPAPRLYPEPTGDVSNVYEDELILVTELRAPSQLSIGTSVKLGADFDYQLCADRCIRGKASLELELPVVAFPSSPQVLWSHPFERAKARHPSLQLEGASFDSAFSHQPLRPGDKRSLILSLKLPGLSPPKDSTHTPVVVFDRVPGFELAPPSIEWKADELLVSTSVELGSEYDGSPPAALEGLIQGIIRDSGQEPGGTGQAPNLQDGGTGQAPNLQDGGTGQAPNLQEKPFALRFSVPFAFASADSEVQAVSHPLLADLPSPAAPPSSPASIQSPSSIPLWQALLLAFLGGLILNIMPCVLPVLSLKALAFVEEAGNSSKRVRSLVGSYVLGVLVSFWLLAGVIIGLKLSGEYVGWGFQFQQPSYVLTMTAIIYGFALSMFGVFEVPGISISGHSSGLKGSFVHGVLTTALSTPCSAPFLGSALAFALTQDAFSIAAIFTFIGLGLAAPIAIITLIPKMRSFVPKPGAWMDTFKQIIAFFLVGTAIYLLTVLTSQLSHDGVDTVLIFLGLLSAALWTLGKWANPISSGKSKLLAWLAALAIIGVGIHYLNFET
ncbi:MAG: protein-disulfide reductase DsbD family protein, partial [Myxococcota bacterium]|nr:protein-disulfide reductase DsbD family protein [Myxococcota bacterium]